MNKSSRHRHPRPGFTIVEILVVISVIAILLALLLPVLGGIQSQGRKTQERNNLRQYGMSWELYSNQNNSSLLPGYLPEDVQEAWDVNYKYEDGEEIEDLEITAPYTWRLLPFLSFNPSAVAGYREAEDQLLRENAETIAETPPFGYNGYYLGGYYEMQQAAGQTVARAKFSSENVVARTVSHIRRADNQIVFTSTTRVEEGEYRNHSDYVDGHYEAVPPRLGEDELWSVGEGGTIDGDTVEDISTIVVIAEEASIPIGRHTGNAAIFFADGHVGSSSPGAMRDMRQWIPRANTRDFEHSSPSD